MRFSHLKCDMEPAATIIEICGGVKRVAKITDRDETRVRRWAYPKAKGGTGGLIPTEAQQELIEYSRKTGGDLKPEHFFPPNSDQEDAA